MVSLSVAIIMAALSADPSGWAEVKYELGGKAGDVDRLKIVGPRGCMQFEEKGVKITIPPTHSEGNVGFRCLRPIVGDFEITLAYEILDVPKPASGYGTGVSLFIEDGVSYGASAQSVRAPEDKRKYVAHQCKRDVSGEYRHQSKSFPVGAESGSLRLSRHGSKITCSIAEGDGGQFRDLDTMPFTSEPIRVVNFFAQPGAARNAATVRLKQLSIRAESVLSPGQEPPASRSPVAALMIVLVVLAIPLGGGWFLWRKRTRAAAPASPTPPATK